jgi:cysteine-S-conjugate beta-lyase
VRLAALERNTLQVARALAERPGVARVLHPALPSCPGHDVWRRDFTGSTSVFSIALADGTSREQTFAFVDALRLFGIGYSWGGVHSLVLPHVDITRDHGGPNHRSSYGDRLVRLNIGLEDPDDLVADLDQALRRAGIGQAP